MHSGAETAWLPWLLWRGPLPAWTARLCHYIYIRRARRNTYKVKVKSAEYFNKPPDTSKPTPPHQDNFYFCYFPCSVVTVWVALDHVDQGNGCLSYMDYNVATGEHANGASKLLPHHASGIKGKPQPLHTRNPAHSYPCTARRTRIQTHSSVMCRAVLRRAALRRAVPCSAAAHKLKQGWTQQKSLVCHGSLLPPH